ncbi:DNA primase catalytic subunit PriS [Methanobacterium sp. CWC-01]|jgi:DNA primase small subunit|uniref:DNA primase catalytic subunit PriS n=1 Tax=Methanobacterium aridiramus TaxID=2584467 RepID=UPI002577E56B|nr:DNA primase catalytic subunit PriS [Methanobacterium sp. CWC-01]WJI08682.1 DNA primase catalytic subunit PriS [Methanobacterium sp. CWC-01]
MEFQKATPEERRRYYREEWDIKQIPRFIRDSLYQREFGFDHHGRGPNDRYRTFRNEDHLRKFMRYRTPFAAYTSVAFYQKPNRREGWLKSELVFDVDAKDLPIRSCQCDSVCELCLDQAKNIVSDLKDTLQGDLGLKEIHMIYSGRGYHLRIQDEEVLGTDSEVRSQIVKYLVGAEVPRSEYGHEGMTYNLEHFTVPFGYPRVFTQRIKQSILHLTEDITLDEVNKKLLKDVIKNRHLLLEDQWGPFRNAIGPIRYKRLTKALAFVNLGLVDAKVSIDLKRILRLPSSLHSMVSMKCTEIKNLETFDPFQDAVPQFVYERKES